MRRGYLQSPRWSLARTGIAVSESRCDPFVEHPQHLNSKRVTKPALGRTVRSTHRSMEVIALLRAQTIKSGEQSTCQCLGGRSWARIPVFNFRTGTARPYFSLRRARLLLVNADRLRLGQSNSIIFEHSQHTEVELADRYPMPRSELLEIRLISGLTLDCLHRTQEDAKQDFFRYVIWGGICER
jgi:hypothetical protein